MKKLIIIVLLAIAVNLTGTAQRKIVNLPDLPGFVTLKCDLHLHTVLSDGNVWPTVRVGEAYRDGLDAIAITDHDTMDGAWYAAKIRSRVLVIPGIEVSTAQGHLLALFITGFMLDMLSMIELLPSDRFLSVLPTPHTYECTCGLLCPLTAGSSGRRRSARRRRSDQPLLYSSSTFSAMFGGTGS